MNCKPGDMAFIVKEEPMCEGNIGKVVRVAGSGLEPNEWLIEFDGELTSRSIYTDEMYIARAGEKVWIPDDYLRPIRPDGITDSEVSELFSPSPAKESEKV